MNFLLPLSVFVAQGLALGVDEFVFHRRRGLPKWERWGHPLDTLTVMIAVTISLVFPPAPPWIGIYLGVGIFSCLWVTKDEWVHAAHCPPGEHWLHSLLFLLHPLVLWAVYSLWRDGGAAARNLLAGLAIAGLGFSAYQALYWNGPWRSVPK